MLFNMKVVWNQNGGLITPICLLAALLIVGIFDPPASTYVMGVFLLLMVGGLSFLERKKTAETHRLREEMLDIENSVRYKTAFSAAEAARWHALYSSVRLDRAAFFKALTSVFPAGYRSENYTIEFPLLKSDALKNEASLQTFLYFDLPAELDLPQHQLRFAVSGAEIRYIGDLPTYVGERTALLEQDSQETLRQYLVDIATEQLKENSDASADA